MRNVGRKDNDLRLGQLRQHHGSLQPVDEWRSVFSCGDLDPEQRRSECGLFFGSIYNTLNHLLVCDLMWLARFKNEPVTVKSLTQELFGDYAQLRQAREQTDKDIIAWAQSLALSPPPERLNYVSLSSNTERNVDFTQAIVHFFNHQTHHRGQVTAALFQQGVDFGVTDLIFMPEEN